MRRMPLEYLPVNRWFWRPGDPERWVKLGGPSYGYISKVGLPDYVPHPTEVVLLDPNYCSECYAQLPWPLSDPCPECGATDEERSSMERIKEVVGNWTGYDDPHI